MRPANLRLKFQLFAFYLYIKLTDWRHPAFKARLKEKDLTVQIKVLDNSAGRYFTFQKGKVTSKSGIHPKPEVTMGFSDAALGARLLLPWRDQHEQTDVMKNFRLTLDGPDELDLLVHGNSQPDADMPASNTARTWGRA